MPACEGQWLRRFGASLMMTTALVRVLSADPAQAQPSPAAAQVARRDFDIAPQPLASGLEQFSRQSGSKASVEGDAARSIPTSGVHGRLTPTEALQSLLAGTGFVVAGSGNGTYTLRRAVAQASVRPIAAVTPVAAAPADGVVALPEVRVTAQQLSPYVDPAAPYKADRLSSSRFTEPVLNTARTVTVVTREALDDKNATALRDVARSTAGVTLGSGEGGNAFGDRFFIRGFDVRNDIFVDGVRDPGVSVRDDFNTEQVEILRGPASSFAGRGTTGGAINIVTKEARFTDFYRFEGQGGFMDGTTRGTIDVNKAVNDKVAVRLNGMGQGAGVAGRQYTTDNRWGVAAAVTVRPTDDITLKGDYSHTRLFGLPDFGVPYNQVQRRPVTETGVPRDTYYGIVNRDFTDTIQDIGTVYAEYRPRDWLTLENKLRAGYSTLNYVGTIPENPAATGATARFASTPTFFSGYTQLNAQSRAQSVGVINDQPQATFRFDTGPIRHTTIVGGEFSYERININTYTGLTSELTTGPVAFTSTGAPIVSVFNPTNILNNPGTPVTGTNPLRYNVGTNAGYLIETANFRDIVIANGGVRYDDYSITANNNAGSRTTDSGLVSYNGNLVVKPIPRLSLYAAYATASQPVGAEVDGTASLYGGLSPTQNTTQIFGPQKSEAYEVGTKFEMFDRHLLASAAAFQTDVTNARETAPAGLPGYTSGQIVAGAAYRVRGLDFELAGKVTDRWSLLGGLVLMNTEVTKSVVPTNIGLRLANIANQSFNLLTKYKVTDWFEIGGQAIFASQVQGGSLLAANGNVAYPNTPRPTIIPSHWRFDLFAEAKITQNMGARLYVQNLLDKKYYDSFYQSAQPFVLIAPGRNVSLIGTLKF